MSSEKHLDMVYAHARREHADKRADGVGFTLTPQELRLRRAIERSKHVTVIEYEHEVRGVRGTEPSILWFDALVWVLDQEGRPMLRGLIDLLPRGPRGNEPRIIQEKIEFAKGTGIPLCLTEADQLVDWRIRLWAWKLREEQRE
jgi:hypothetical protein